MIGSGATAVTLVPALAAQGAQVTMLQRSPSYIATVPSIDKTAERLQQRWPARVTYSVVRWKYVLTSILTFRLSRRQPERMKALLRRGASARLPAGFDLDTHLTPSYEPWDQRLCATPDGDLFRAIRSGSADIVTEEIDRFTTGGVRLRSGRQLAADVIITATGLDLLAFGGMELVVDDRVVDPAETIAYKGMMMSGRTELLSHARLHQRLLDAQGGSGGALRLPAAPVSRSSPVSQRHAGHTGPGSGAS